MKSSRSFSLDFEEARRRLEVWTMIQITPQMRIWLAVEPVDFRKGIDGLAQVCRQHLKLDPMASA
jgi:transposase